MIPFTTHGYTVLNIQNLHNKKPMATTMREFDNNIFNTPQT